jgi:TRAP-type C4-dicarboxylate transport system permease small subunit
VTAPASRPSPATAEPRGFGRLVSRIVGAGAVLSGVSVLLILGLVCVEVIMRQGFNRSTMIADEIGGYLNVAVVFLGMAYTLREGGFIRVEILYDRLTGAFRRAADLFSIVVSLAFTLALGWYLASHVAYAWQHGTRANSVLQTPEWLPQSVTVLGCIVLALQLASFLGRRQRLP